MIFAEAVTQAAGNPDSVALWVSAGGLTTMSVIMGFFAKLLLGLRREQREIKADRKEEIRSVVSELITQTPEKMVVSPQPFIVEMAKKFAEKEDLEDIKRRLGNLENWRDGDNRELSRLAAEVAAMPSRVSSSVIAQMRDTLALFAKEGGARR